MAIMKMRFGLILWRMKKNSKMMSFWTPEMVVFKQKPWDHDALPPYFGLKPVKVIKHTMAVTTQYAKIVMYLPMRRHTKSCFPALHAHDGSTCAQLYCGRKRAVKGLFSDNAKAQTSIP
eukprot:1812700-Ditylum_brightwellii.AAC.1